MQTPSTPCQILLEPRCGQAKTKYSAYNVIEGCIEVVENVKKNTTTKLPTPKYQRGIQEEEKKNGKFGEHVNHNGCNMPSLY
ncbi:uncharacterized protein VTP21DRAFT_1750 [Calcarisporiella thermophila]|uniref:uncharacterized protein n=1 Tax=Calcarisporiella thermophila TaxID=911321 RepID=UPI003741EACC